MQSRTPEIPAEAWFKSSYSGANTSECVEAAAVLDGAAVRDSKYPYGPQIAFDTHAWASFLAALRDNRLS
ncbi:DUF397 domain-containing protein [Streptomyces sp. NBC_01142]|uniref:DUF397 domain-containing protein n=1 Tax=Streptomyces sp. NBC_01142 TaxID=2975865 RepID=UPI002250C19B|nr:DUF397 domain-containing protein [Streptomyces sp. NBC_01142]MCX4823360.1 DUF397 domain-containing protein [Streptomyces sp. NBC_01142]